MMTIAAVVLLSQQPVLPTLEGIASFYTIESSSTLTASGETYDDELLTCAMRYGRFGEYYRITADNGKSVVVRLNDRGPYIDGRIIDLSRGAMRRLDPSLRAGLVHVKIERVDPIIRRSIPSNPVGYVPIP